MVTFPDHTRHDDGGGTSHTANEPRMSCLAAAAPPPLPVVVVDRGVEGATAAPAVPFEIWCGLKMGYRAQA